MDSYIQPDSKTIFIINVFVDDEYFSSYLQNKNELGILSILRGKNMTKLLKVISFRPV